MAEKNITLKELFERIVSLETKYDLSIERNNRVAKRFTWYVVFILFLEICNLIVHSMLFF